MLKILILSHRTEDNQMYEDRIVIDPEVRHGKPIIKDTRVPIGVILGSLAGGMDIDEITKEYDLEREDVLAALAYAAPNNCRRRDNRLRLSSSFCWN